MPNAENSFPIPCPNYSLCCAVCCIQSLQSCPTLSTPWTVARQAPLSIGFSRQEYWSGLPCPPLPNPGIQPRSPALQADSLPSESPGKPLFNSLATRRLPWPSLSPGACSNSCPLSQWCHPTILSSVIPFSSCLQPFTASGFFLMIQLFTSGGQSYWSFSFSISPSSEYSGLISFRIDWFDIFTVQGTLKSLL